MHWDATYSKDTSQKGLMFCVWISRVVAFYSPKVFD